MDNVCYLTEAELEPYRNIMDEVNMDDVLMASSLIDGYLGRSLALTQFTDRVKLNRNNRGKLSHAPVVEVQKIVGVSKSMFGRNKQDISLDEIELDPEMDGYFTFSGNYGLTSMLYTIVPESVIVTYTSGFKEYPQRLKSACGMLACNIRQAKSFAGAKQLTSMDFQVLMTDDSFFTSDIKLLLKGLSSDVRNL